MNYNGKVVPHLRSNLKWLAVDDFQKLISTDLHTIFDLYVMGAQ